MIFPDYPEGVDTLTLLRDLRSVVKDAKLRAWIMGLYRSLESGGQVSVVDVQRVRAEARSRRSRIALMHESRDRIPVTDLKKKIGSERFSALHRSASRATARRNMDRLASAEAEVADAQAESEDLGI